MERISRGNKVIGRLEGGGESSIFTRKTKRRKKLKIVEFSYLFILLDFQYIGFTYFLN